MTLPAKGRGRRKPPAWPLAGGTSRERDLWERVWRLPQAVEWERQHLADQVALYCRRLAIAEQPDATAADATLVRQLQDSLGLSAPGMRSLRWRIEDVRARGPRVSPVPVAARDRLRVVAASGFTA